MLQDVEGVEKDPHRMRGIRQAALRKRVGREEITELVVDNRQGNRLQRKNRNAKEHGEHTDSKYDERLFPCQAGCRSFDCSEPSIPNERFDQTQGDEKSHCKPEDKRHPTSTILL